MTKQHKSTALCYHRRLCYFVVMSDQPKDVRLPVMVSRSQVQAIDDWRFRSKIPTRAEAIRRLLDAGLAASEPAKPAPKKKGG
jgi:hypothetical protein